jgi:hypothetical protein
LTLRGFFILQAMIIQVDLDVMYSKNVSPLDMIVYGFLNQQLQESDYTTLHPDYVLGSLVMKKDTFYRICKRLAEKELLYVEYEKRKYVVSTYPRSTKNQKVYLIFDRNTGLYKIGKSNNAVKRETTLAAQLPFIELVCVIDSVNVTERSLHHVYKTKRVRGEWFNLTQEDVEYIKSL